MIKKFSIPNYYSYGSNIIFIANYKDKHPDYFFEDRVIDSAYDAPPELIWSGGRLTRIINKQYVPMMEILKTFSSHPEIKLRHTLTNTLITPELTKDYTCNHFVKTSIRRNGDSIIVSNPVLIDYLKQTYPEIPLIYSTIMDIKDIDKVNEISENNIYIMNYNYNNDNSYIDKLQHKENIEILCADSCAPNCPYRKSHYDILSRIILDVPQKPFVCNSLSHYFDEVMKLPHAVDNDRVNELSDMGIQYFKIVGRTLGIPSWLYTVLYYLVKPEYLLHVYLEILNAWW